MLALGKEFNTLSICYGQTSDHFINEVFRVKDYDFEKMGDVAVGKAFGTTDEKKVSQAPTSVGAPTTTNTTTNNPASAAAAVPQGDLLDLGMVGGAASLTDSNSNSTPTLILNPNVTVDGQTFQNMWRELPVSASCNTPLANPTDTGTTEILLASENILTMASGEMPDLYKFFLYCQETSTSSLFLIEALVKKNPLGLNATVKTNCTGEQAVLKSEAVVNLISSLLI